MQILTILFFWLVVSVVLAPAIGALLGIRAHRAKAPRVNATIYPDFIAR